MARRFGRTNLVENLMTALAKAKDDGVEEFEYDGKTYKVSDFDDENSVEEQSAGGENVPAAEIHKPNTNRSKRNSASGSTAKDNITAESVWADVSSKPFYGEIARIFEGEDFSPEFLDRAHAVFESAISERTYDIAERLEEEANLKLDMLVEERVEEAVSQIDDYLTYVVNEWKEENKIAIQRGIKSDICESFMSGLKNLFEAHYIEMPESKYDALEESNKEVENLKRNLSEQIRKNSILSRENKKAEDNIREIGGKFQRIIQETNDTFERSLQESHARYQTALDASMTLNQCDEIFNEISRNLTETQAEKLKSLAESIDFEDVQEFQRKLVMIKESVFASKRRSRSRVLDEDHQSIDKIEEPFKNVRTAEYAKYMSRKSLS